MKKIQMMLLSALVVILVAVLIFIWREGGRLNFKASDLRGLLPPEIDMRLTNLVLNEAGKDNQSFSVAAESAKYFKVQDLFILDKVIAQFKNDGSQYYITAQSGRYEPEKQMATLSGDVEIKDDQNRVLKAPSLDFNLETGVMSSTEIFTLTGPQLDLSGTGFNLATKDHKLKVLGRVKMVVK